MAVLRRILHLVMPMAFLLMAGGPVFAQPASKHDAKAQWQIAPRHALTVSGFGSRDGYNIGFPGTEYTLGWENAMGHLSYRFTLPAATIKADASFNHFKNRMEHAAVVRGEESLLQLQSKIDEQNYAVTAEHRFYNGHFLLSEGIRHQRLRGTGV